MNHTLWRLATEKLLLPIFYRLRLAMIDVDEKTVKELRCVFIKHASIIDVLKFLVEKHGLNKHSRLIVIKYIREAFLLKLGEASSVGAWDFFEGGTWTDDEIEEELNPGIMESQKYWGLGI
jgi:hypothetical protein